MEEKFELLRKRISGGLYTDQATRILYATDASAYREMPMAVATPKSEEDILALVEFADHYEIPLIPRTAGTSLAGQVVGDGIVMDLSTYMNQILEVNSEQGWVRVQPGVIRDDLNRHLARYGKLFGPETATASRAMIGGMIGNNSCGANSIVYGSTREHLLEVRAVLSDGSVTTFKNLSDLEFVAKCRGQEVNGERESEIYQSMKAMLMDPENQQKITEGYPKPSIPRRNTGYALDQLLLLHPFSEQGESFNFCKLIAGSEGTLAIVTEAKLKLMPMPPPEQCLVCIHFDSIHQSLLGNLVALKYQPTACEMIDHYILECTKENIEQRKNRFFVKGDPKVIIIVEFRGDDPNEVIDRAQKMILELQEENLGYHYPLITGEDAGRVWQLRKAGLGLLANIPGEAKAAPVIEDTAVDVQELPDYISEFNQILEKHGLYSVHYAHAGTGELHLRPILNLKTREGQRMFRTIAEEIAVLVKKYRGSLSGEHGDGRLRSEFIPFMVGDHNYQLIRDTKRIWDPKSIFNRGKIVDSQPMDTHLRYEPDQVTPQFETVLNFDHFGGIIQAAEQCNGAGECRRSHLSGGTMCPSYMVTRHEKDTTRARANVLRELLTRSRKENPFAHDEIKEVMDLCLSCKGCKAECPSNVDVAKLKAEFQHHYYNSKGIPWRTRLITSFNRANSVASKAPGLYNFLISNPLTGGLFKSIAGFAPQRTLPKLHNTTLRKWFRDHNQEQVQETSQKVMLFCDEFTNFNDTKIGIMVIKLLNRLGYQVVMPEHLESGRTYISKGMLNKARNIAIANVQGLKDQVGAELPLIGIEPSAILSFRDEYPDMMPESLKKAADHLVQYTFTFEEFLASELDKGRINAALFTDKPATIRLHGHCHQKAISSLVPSKKILSIPSNYQVQLIPSGCCGMAGSFGYEKEHYDLSMKVGELVLFPTIREADDQVIIAAAGTSCRHQIKDGTGREALHPAEILWQALI